MASIEQYNEEQLEMLCLTVEDTTSGICLFQLYDAEKQLEIAEVLKTRIRKKSCIIDMAWLEEDNLPNGIDMVKKLLQGNEDCNVVIMCNLQICGIAFGNEIYIQNLNYMRDQLLAMNKVWVFGMAPYFATILARQARDLSSCIMNHFEFKEYDDEQLTEFEEDTDFSGDWKLQLLQYRDLKSRIKKEGIKHSSEDELLQVLNLWDTIYESSNETDVKYIQKISNYLAENLKQVEVTAERCLKYQIVVKTQIRLEKLDDALVLEQRLCAQAEQILSAESYERNLIYRYLGEIYFRLKQFEMAETYISKVVIYYTDVQKGDLQGRILAFDAMARLYIMTGKVSAALEEYQKLQSEVAKQYGSDYLNLYFIWNNMGVAYNTMKQYSEALECFLEADRILSVNQKGKRKERVNVLKNIGKVYGKIGDNKKAIKYLKMAECAIEVMDPILKNKMLKTIYELLAEAYARNLQGDMSRLYIEKKETVSESKGGIQI